MRYFILLLTEIFEFKIHVGKGTDKRIFLPFIFILMQISMCIDSAKVKIQIFFINLIHIVDSISMKS